MPHLYREHDTGIVFQTEVIGWRITHDALGNGGSRAGLECFLECHSELWCARFGFLQRFRNRPVQYQIGVIAMRGELISGAFTILFFIAIDKICCQLFGWMILRRGKVS